MPCLQKLPLTGHISSTLTKTRCSPKNDYNSRMPFKEISHTADWSLRVWGEDLTQLFLETARGMNAIAGIKLAKTERVQRLFSTSAPDAESLLVSFLSELVFYADKDQLGFDDFDLNLIINDMQPCHLSAILHGATILSLVKTIKAVTFHNLHILQTVRGVEVEIVFDV
jgi:SHS2 domain-containing protein